MNLKESFLTALAALFANKLRALLTMLGIIIGVGAVIAMVSIGQGAQVRRKAIPNTFWELSELAGCSGGEIETVGHARELYSKLGFQLVPGDGLLAFPFPLPFGGAEVSGVLTIFHFFQDGQVFQRDQGSHIFPSTAHNDPFSLTSHAI